MDLTVLKESKILHQRWIAGFVFVFLFAVMLYATITFLPIHADANPPETWGFSVDWKGWIRPATLALLAGESPYELGYGLQPPWAYLLLAPIALLPAAYGAAVLFVCTYWGYGFALYRMGAKPLILLLFMLNPLVFTNAHNGNID